MFARMFEVAGLLGEREGWCGGVGFPQVMKVIVRARRSEGLVEGQGEFGGFWQVENSGGFWESSGRALFPGMTRVGLSAFLPMHGVVRAR